MLKIFLAKLLKPFFCARLRQVMRGYRKLRQSGQLNRISSLKEDLTQTKLTFKNTKFSSLIMGAGALHAEVVIRQYLLVRIGGHALNSALLRSLGKKNGSVVFPLPREWQKIIKNHGFSVDSLKSNFLWQLYIFGALLYGSLKAFKIIFVGLKSLRLKSLKSKKYVYFAMLALGNLPQKFNQSKSYDVVSWYLLWENRARNVEVICHSVPNVVDQAIGDVEIHSQSELLPSLGSMKSCCKYFYWCCFSILLTAFDFIRGRWWYALLLNQAALSAQVRCLKKESLALDYLFHNSGPIYRPLWTYDAERLGSRIIFYFYSTNSENFRLSNVEASIPYGWKAMSWPHILVWDVWQEAFVRKAQKINTLVELVGPIWFNDGHHIDLPNLKNLIAVFDVEPQRNSSYQIYGHSYEYYIPKVANNFIMDIYKSASSKNLNITLKKKRDIGKRAHPSYRYLIKNLNDKSNFYEISPELSPWAIIDKSIAVISMPFTSTALIARHLGKPSIYYDPTGLLRNDDPAAHGIQVLSSFAELDDWVQNISFLE